MMRPVALVVGLLLLTGCGAGTVAARPAATTAARPTSSPGPYGDCPVPKPTRAGSHASIDYVDYLDAQVEEYSGGPDPTLTDADRGAQQLSILCTISSWSDGYGQGTSQRDGNAAFLPAGTAVYAVIGQLPACQLMARYEDGWHRYVAEGTVRCPVPVVVATAQPPIR